MRLRILTLSILLVTLIVSCQTVSRVEPTESKGNPVWVSDNGDGTYKNPIMFADYSDPDVVRVGEDFYLTASSFANVPGLPILHSKDLVNWTNIGHVFDRFPYGQFNVPQHGNGVWAPSIRYHNGEFYVYYGDPDYGIFMAKTKNPAGPWEPLVRVREAKGWIDCCPFWDDDGNAYLVHAFARSRAGINNVLHLNRMNPNGESLLDDGKLIIDGAAAGVTTLEGAKLYKRNGWYYILAPAGGVSRGYQMAFRSRNIDGPYEQKKVLAQGSTPINGPHQGGWVELESGESWFIHFQDRGAYGRITHLQPVKWVDDWPLMGIDQNGEGTGAPVLTYKKPDVGRNYPIAVPQTSDEFSSRELGFQWQWESNSENWWSSLTARPGWLRLSTVSRFGDATNLWAVGNLILQKFPAPEFTVTTKLDLKRLAVSDKAGLLVMGTNYSYLAVERTSRGFRLVKSSCKNAQQGTRETEEARVDCTGDTVLLRVKVSTAGVCQFSCGSDGKEFTPLGQPFTACAGRWIGAKVGLFCVGPGRTEKASYADFDWFRFE